MNSGMSKTAWCWANRLSEKPLFYWQRILRWEAYEASQNPSLPAVTEIGQLSAVEQSVSFAEIKLPAVSLEASSVFQSNLVIRKGELALEIANVKHFFTLLGKMFFTSYGKEFFTYLGKQIFTS